MERADHIESFDGVRVHRGAVLHDRQALHERLELGFIDHGQIRGDTLLCCTEGSGDRHVVAEAQGGSHADNATSASQRPSTLSAAHRRHPTQWSCESGSTW